MNLACSNFDDCLKDFEEKIENGSIEENSILDFGLQIDCLDWDSLLIVAPFMPIDEINEKIGLKIVEMNVDESKYDLYFVKDKRLIKSSSVKRNLLDFSPIFANAEQKEGYLYLTKKNSIFKVAKTRGINNKIFYNLNLLKE